MNSINNAASTKKNNSLYFIIFMICLAAVVAIASSSNVVRSYFDSANNSTKNRIILAKLFTSYNDINYVIFKIKTDAGVDIEIYEKDNVTYFQKLKQKFSFPEDKNAFLMVNGNSITLALSDVDKNGVEDIIVPTADQYGLSRLNVFKFDSELNQFSQSVSNDEFD